MIVPGSANPLLLGQTSGYNLTNSLRFRSSASAYLSRTPASAGNRQVFTYSVWTKRGVVNAFTSLFNSNGTNGSDYGGLRFTDTAALQFFDGTTVALTSTAVYRDPSAWYHIVLQVDTTQATSSNRIRLYVNGVQITSFSTANYPTQNYNTAYSNTVLHAIGSQVIFGSSPSTFFDGYMTEINFIDGQALTPSSFGQSSPTTGVWQPKKYAGTYGTNGFYLPFTNNSTTTTLGNDFSGNGNNWTTNNISLTAGATYDSMTDVPTLTSATASNFCTWNPLRPSSYGACAIADGNLKASQSASAYVSAISTFAMPSGKWYWEITCSSIGFVTSIGITNTVTANGAGASGAYTYHYDGTKYVNGSGSAYGASYTSGDVLGFAYDADAGSLTCYKNGTSQGVLASGLTPTDFYIWATLYGTWNIALNCGQRPFAYTPPTGFVALNTYNLPTPTIGATASSQANKYFDATTYTGNGSTQSIVNSGSMQPSLVWAKQRNGTNYHALFDSVRGATLVLQSNTTTAEQTFSTALTSFNSNGFTSGSSTDTNQNGQSYVAWQWAGNGTGVTNTAGSITSTVSANTSSGFSIVTYTGNGTAGATIGHGLGVAPKWVIVKARSGARSWNIYTESLGNTKAIYLNLTNGADTNILFWNNTSPTSSVFTVGSGGDMNANGVPFVAYCFAEIAGFSKFGSYTGNGSTDGTFVYTGFRPRFIMVKSSSQATDWAIFDTATSQYNATPNFLRPNTSGAEATGRFDFDILSNGFKARDTGSINNSSTQTYIFMAFAESPFKYSLAR